MQLGTILKQIQAVCVADILDCIGFFTPSFRLAGFNWVEPTVLYAQSMHLHRQMMRLPFILHGRPHLTQHFS